MKLISLFIAVAITSTTFSQIKTGVILSSVDDTPVAYANIYSKNSSNGTVSNDEGYFKLNYTEVSDSIIISHLGYSKEIYHINDFFEKLSDTIYLKPKIVQLAEVTIFGGEPREIIKKAVKNLKANYPVEPNSIMCHFRSIIKEDEEFVFFTEGASLIANTTYLSKKEQASKIQIYDVRSSTNKSKIFTSFRASLKNNIDAISFYENKPFLLKDLNNYEFIINGIVPFDNYLVYVVRFNPNPRLKRKFVFEGTLYIETTTHAFVKMDYTITALSEKFSFVRYKGLDNEFVQTYLNERYEILFRPLQSKWGISYVNTETLSTVNFTKDNSQIKILLVNELLISNSNQNKKIDESKTISIKDDIHKHSDSFDAKMWTHFNQILRNEKLQTLMGNSK